MGGWGGGKREPGGAPIVRIAGGLNGMAKIIYRELGLGVRNPEGVWDWLGKKRSDLKVTSRNLTNREVYNYFKDYIVLKSHKLGDVVGPHFISLELWKIWRGPTVRFPMGTFPNI